MIRGIDISSYEPDLDFDHLKSIGIAFVFTKLAEGMGAHADSTFARNVSEAKRVGIPLGPYVFVHPMPAMDPIEQAKLHFKLAGEAPLPLPLAIDLEYPDPQLWEHYGCSRNQIADWTLAYSAEATSLWGRRPLLYTYPGFAAVLDLASSFAAFDLWIASYDVHDWPIDPERPVIPRPWTSWLFWQWSGGSVKLPNTSGKLIPVDTDVFAGDQLPTSDASIVTADPAVTPTTAVT